MIALFFNKINNFVLRIENSKINICWFLLFSALIWLIRQILEIYIFSTINTCNNFSSFFKMSTICLFMNNYIYFYTIIANSIWFINMLLLISYILSVFLKEKFLKILKLILMFSFVILSVPLYEYLFWDNILQLTFIYFVWWVKEIFIKIFTLNAFVEQNRPIFFEWMIIIVSLVYYMIFIKKISWYKSIIYTYFTCVISHLILWFWYIQPESFITKNAIFYIHTFLRVDLFSFQIVLYILITSIILLLILFKHTNYPFLAFLKNIRFKRLFLFFLFYIWWFIELKSYFPNSTIYFIDIILCFLPFLFYWIFAIHLNDINDLEIDKITNKERPLIKYNIDIEIFEWICNCSFFISFFLSYWLFLNKPILIIINLLNFLLCFLYCQKPIYLRKYFFSILIVALVDLTPFFYSSALFWYDLLSDYKIWQIYLALFAASIFIFNIKDIKDIEWDKRNKIQNIFTIFWLDKWKKIFAILNLVWLGAFVLISQKYNYLPFVILTWITTTIYLFYAKKPKEKAFFYIFFVAIILWMFLQYFNVI